MFQKHGKKKEFLLTAQDIRPLVESRMGCIATDRITVDGLRVGFCYREKTDGTRPDSGWRFFSGDESDAYLDDPDNSAVFALNTIANYDPFNSAMGKQTLVKISKLDESEIPA